MAILTERKVWRRKPATPARQSEVNRLSRDESDNVTAAMVAMRARLGSVAAVAKAMGVSWDTVAKVACGVRRPGAGFALRLARAMGVPVEAVLSGDWAKEGACPMCERCG